ncbi:MAG: sugar phosphate isomerase/epimerase family protein [Bryobacteraceae bacterium]
MAFFFRHSICNEVFDKWNFADGCRAIRKAGYTGIEIAHFTLAEDPQQISAGQRREYRDIMASEGLEFVGLHWLMVSPKGLHVTTPDNALRERSWNHIRSLIDLCADLGPGGILVFGSPAQRRSTGGSTRAESTRRWVDGFGSVAAQAAERGVTILVEALPSADSDVCNTVAEAVSIVQELNSPAIRTMFDSHNAADETEPHAAIVDRYFDYIRHVHVNEMDGRYPGTGDYDFRSLFEVLQRRNYSGWVSLEVFDFKPGPVAIAERSLRYLESQIASMAQTA